MIPHRKLYFIITCGFELILNRRFKPEDISKLVIKISNSDSHLTIAPPVINTALKLLEKDIADNTNVVTERYRGYLQNCNKYIIHGWAVDKHAPDVPVKLDVFIGELYLTTIEPDIIHQ